MLRWAVWLLVLGNVGYFAWSQGYLEPLGAAPAEQREPQRLVQQVKPETVRLLNDPGVESAPAHAPPAPAVVTEAVAAPQPAPAGAPATAGPLEAAAPPVAADSAPRACWQAGGFTAAQVELLRAELVLLDLPPASHVVTEVRRGSRWIVYLGRYDNLQQLERKKDELRGLGVSFREITAPGLAPGLALGTYATEAAAQQSLQKAERDGIRTAKVAQERAESVSFNLRLPSITERQRASIDGLSNAMAGQRLQRCK